MREFLTPKEGFRVIFVIGKGGVGKTTSSASISVALAKAGYRTLIVSLDPAHNLGDVFMEKLSDKPREIIDNLYASELDMEGMIKGYLEHLEKNLKNMYRYLTVINLEKYFEVLRYSPGIEEYATLEAIREILVKGDEWDVIVFDTPPTGLTLRVLALPRISLVWTEKLIDIRKKILERRRAITKIQGEQKFVIDGEEIKLPTREEEDAVMRELKAYRDEIKFVEDVLTNPNKTSVIAVMNPEFLPLYETKRAYESLKKFKIPFNMVVMNKVIKLKREIPEIRVKLEAQEKVLSEVKREFPGVEIVEIPMFQEEPRGIEWLSKVGEMIVGR
ncbi:ArsA family ATPase [Pyrococcus abyssi]|uniref:Anion transporting atpase n=1 Tax=Pyrococcus abyssi (strain GE5 / Orsay) TaxID=272844 RepID=Q9UZA6_PYRAB|nr:ArsA family ATPase [Pyrococcus abyssi]CAB50153.1 arsA putative arsenical pump-driving ATPase (arsenite-translocating ATPase) (arsenical resistance ATPase) [Pyrococcus abyssi GE5]CCE70684.1 TPA: anion transporting atpase [Pyrococcus abyssi GE5]